MWRTFFSILTASFPSIPRFNIKDISFAITILLSKFYYRTGSLRLGYESNPLNHHSHQPTKLRRLFLSSPTFITTHAGILDGGNCRCTVVQVRKQKYPATEHSEAMSRGEEAMNGERYNIFRFNSGKQGKTMPDYNPYTIKRCNDCDVARGVTRSLGLCPTISFVKVA